MASDDLVDFDSSPWLSHWTGTVKATCILSLHEWLTDPSEPKCPERSNASSILRGLPKWIQIEALIAEADGLAKAVPKLVMLDLIKATKWIKG